MPTMRKIGYIGGFYRTSDGATASKDSLAFRLNAAFVEGLRRWGYTEGQDVDILYPATKFAASEQYFEYAQHLVAEQVELIIIGLSRAFRPTLRATRTIPLVMTMGSDPVEAGFVESLELPGCSVTGLTIRTVGMAVKQFDLLREVAPRTSRVAVLHRPSAPNTPREQHELAHAATVAGITLQFLPVMTVQEIHAAFDIMDASADALLILPDPMLNFAAEDIARLAIRSGLPTIGGNREFADAGGLIGYGPDREALFHRAGAYAAKILGGASPAELPIEQATKFDLVINRATAATLRERGGRDVQVTSWLLEEAGTNGLVG
jgi:putative ABC transport system substrate-binding protein